MEVLNAIILSVSLVALVVLYAYFFRKYHVDAFRQRVFAVRDEMFDYAASGKISFQDPAYRMLRQLMNGYIRFGHRISIFHIFTVMTLTRMFNEGHRPGAFRHQLNEALSKLPKETRRDLARFHDEAEMNLVYFLMLGSGLKKIVAIPMILFLAFLFLVKRGIQRFDEFSSFAYRHSIRTPRMRRSLDVANEDAYCEGFQTA
jgi:hypothetical protein